MGDNIDDLLKRLEKARNINSYQNTSNNMLGSDIDIRSNLSNITRKPNKKENNINVENFDINELLLLFKIDESEEELDLEKVQRYTDDFINKIPDSHTTIKDMLMPSKDKLINYFVEKSKINSNKVENNISLLTLENDNSNDRADNMLITRTSLDKDTKYEAPVKQGKINPKLENIIQRTLVIDSRYRQFNYYPTNKVNISSTSAVITNPFTIDLEYPISDLLSFKLFSLHIPLVWNTVSSEKRNNIFFISNRNSDDIEDLVDNPMDYLARDDNGNLFLNKESEFICKTIFIPVVVPDNKYSNITDLINEINISIKNSINFYNEEIFPKCTNNSEINDMITSDDIRFIHNEKFNKIEIVIKRGSVKFFTMHNNVKLDYSLGWMLGFRKLYYAFDEKNINDNNENIFTSESSYDISDTKYVMIYIDDFLQNRINTNVECTGDSTVSTVSTSNKNTITDMPVAKDSTNLDEYQKIIKETPTRQASDFIYLPNKPRTHTQKEIYAFSQTQTGENSIENTFKSARLKPPVTTNCFALIPIKGTSSNTDENNYPYIDFSGSLQAHERKYFGPVNLRRLKITLVDDKGFEIDLKGLNWSFVIQCDVLYQY